MLKCLSEACKLQVYGRFKIKNEADLIHCYVNSTEENHNEQIEDMRLYIDTAFHTANLHVFYSWTFSAKCKNWLP